MKVKDFGQVFTPIELVKDILDVSNYKGKGILKKHVIDNSCGNGAFLIEIIDRYIKEYYKEHSTYNGIKNEIETYIHGIEYDTEIWKECIYNLKEKCNEYNIQDVKFDILNKDALKTKKYNGKMDFVLGNPPYVRVHNLDKQYDSVKKYLFSKSGMTDLYIVFYEIGIKMLNKSGVLCYITPNSFYTSLAGKELRQYIMKNRNMEVVMDLGHYQPFNVTTYTTICKICKNKKFDVCKYFKYDTQSGKPQFISDIKYKDLFIDGNMILSKDNGKYLKYLNYNVERESKVQVKNGFATLNDKIFIDSKFDFKKNTIDVLKASTGQWKKCIYPYDENGKIIPFNKLNKKLQKYLEEHHSELTQGDSKIDGVWYGFGRSQAINDVKLNKIAINTCIKDIDSIKLNLVEENKGLYSGLYILTDKPFEAVKEKICSQDFIEYLKLLNKCKSGGYYTFSSKDLSKFLNCSLEETKIENNVKTKIEDKVENNKEKKEENKMENNEFLNKIVKDTFYTYLHTNSRSNKKLKIIHGAIARDLSSRLGEEYKIHSLGFGNGKEVEMLGRYAEKKVDIAIENNKEIIGAIAFKFIMRNYSQNSNNYFENMLGETANIRLTEKPYFQILIVPSKVPYFNSDHIITKMESITSHNLEKYINLSNENTNELVHVPNKMLLYVIDIPGESLVGKNYKQYVEYYKNINNFNVTPNTEKYDFGDIIIYNDYNKFIEEVVSSTLKI